MASRNGAMPRPGGYWFTPLAIACSAASSMNAGPSVSGNPWPRFTEPVARASADISAKIVVVDDWIRSAFHCDATLELYRQGRALPLLPRGEIESSGASRPNNSTPHALVVHD